MKKLLNVLIAKSILDTILVGAIAVAAYANAFPPTFRGLIRQHAMMPFVKWLRLIEPPVTGTASSALYLSISG